MIKLIWRLTRNLLQKNYDIKIIENNSDPLLNESYKFRYQMYCVHDKLLDYKKFPNKEENDEYDKYSIHIIAIDKIGKIIGMLRLIKHSDLIFPTVKEFSLHKNVGKIDLNKVVEVSRIIVAPNYRKTFLLIDLLKTAAYYSKRNNIRYWLGCIEIWFYKTLTKLFGSIELIADPKYCFNAMNYPFLLKLSEVKSNLKKNNLLLYFLLKKYI